MVSHSIPECKHFFVWIIRPYKSMTCVGGLMGLLSEICLKMGKLRRI